MKKLLILCFCVFCAISFSFAQNAELDKTLNLDPNVKIGKLENGLTYYIRHNEYPKNRVELRLAVNAGSNQENENQRGLAHFTEHMAFNGIEGYPGNTMIAELQKIGVAFGLDLNAGTSFDETIYMIPMPLDNPGNLDLGMNILRGWAHGLLYDAKEIEAERGVISEEYRMGLGADDRMRKQYWPVLMKGTRYADRMPIGLIEVIQGFEHQTIKDFYHDWYRPDLEAIIVVGDIDVAQVEQKIKEKFSNIPALENPRTKEHFQIVPNKEPLISVCTDKEASTNSLLLIRKHPHFAVKTIGDLRKQLIIDLYNTMYNARYSEMLQDPKCPFNGAGAGYGHLIGLTDCYSAQASCKENQILPSLQKLMQEDYRILKHGFVQTELDRAKEELLEDYERPVKELDKTESSFFADEYVNHYLHQDPIPGAKRTFNYVKKFMDGISLDEVNALAKEWITPENLVAIVTAPEKEGVIVPTEAEILATLSDKSLENVTPYVDNYKDQEIVDKASLKPGTIVSEEKIEAINATKITLSNGINVYLKKTDFKNDEIQFYAISKGGYSLYNVEDLPNLRFATQMVDRAGIAELDYNTLTKKMKSKKVYVSPFLDEMHEGFQGLSSPKDLEFFFQYLNAFFTNPRYDENTKTLILEDAAEKIKSYQSQIMYKFIGAYLEAASGHDPYKKNLLNYSLEDLEQVNYDRSFQLYKERFANPADFNFFFVGNYDEQIMKDFLCTYLASMPANQTKENYKNVFKKPADSIVREEIKYGQENQGWFGLYFQQPIEWNYKNSLLVQGISQCLDISIVNVIREKMGGTYSPSLQMAPALEPDPRFVLVIFLSCDPDKTDILSDACLNILKDFQTKGPDKKTLEKVKMQLLSARQKEIQTNEFWLSYLTNRVNDNLDMDIVNHYEELVNSITKKDIINFMKQYFKLDQYIRLDLNPEK